MTAGSAGEGPTAWDERFKMLDTFRGLAAVAVVLDHVADLSIGNAAVMVFFVISGYCVTAAAESCLKKGYSVWVYMARRIKRIYPPYLLSLLFWASTRVLKCLARGADDLSFRSAVAWLQNITLTQWISLVFQPRPHPSQNPVLFVCAYWSLCYEEQFYLFLGLLLILAAARRVPLWNFLVPTLAVAGLWNLVFRENCTGFFLEYWLMFGTGMIVFYRLCRPGHGFAARVGDGCLWAALTGAVAAKLFAGTSWIPSDGRRSIGDDLIVGLAFSLFLIGVRRFDGAYGRTLPGRVLGALGKVSFSLYLIHQFNLHGVASVANWIAAHAAWFTWGPASAALQGALHIGLAAIFYLFCERPFLNRPLEARPQPESVAVRAVPAPAA